MYAQYSPSAMRTNTKRVCLPAKAVAAVSTALLCALAASAQTSQTDTVPPAAYAATAANTRPTLQMPAGFLYLYDVDGSVSIHKGGKAIASPVQQTLEADQPLQVTLGSGATVATVFSNGVALWAKGPGNFTIKRFEQQPFQGNSRQTPYEPTTSTLEIDLGKGTFAFAERHLSALSTLRLNFGEDHVLDAQETASFLVEVGAGVQGNQDRISVINGRALLHYHGQRGAAVLLGSGQYLQLGRNQALSTQQLRLPEQLTTTQMEIDARQANRSQIINDRIWFTRDSGSAAATAQVVVPVNFWLGKPHAATRIR